MNSYDSEEWADSVRLGLKKLGGGFAMRIVSDGVIESILHPLRFIEIPDKQILFVPGSEVPCLRFWQRRLIQPAGSS